MPQVVLDDFPHPDRLVHGALEEREAVPALAFRLIEGGVREAHENLMAHAVLRREGDPDGNADRNLSSGDLEGAADRVENAPRQGLRVRGRSNAGLDDREFVAAKAGESVGAAQEIGQALRDLLDQLVAGRVPVRVVHVLEPVEVQEHHRDAALRPAEAADLLIEAVREEQPVRQARERIQPDQDLGLLLAMGEILSKPADRENQKDQQDHRDRGPEEHDREDALANEVAWTVRSPGEKGAGRAGRIHNRKEAVMIRRGKRDPEALDPVGLGELPQLRFAEALDPDQDRASRVRPERSDRDRAEKSALAYEGGRLRSGTRKG